MSAFRLLIVNPADFDLLGIKFDNMYYIDKCLAMDCSVSCNLFEKYYISFPKYYQGRNN
jgi:hypothetical protein